MGSLKTSISETQVQQMPHNDRETDDVLGHQDNSFVPALFF